MGSEMCIRDSDLTPLLPADAAGRYLPSVWQACRDPDAGQIAVPWYLTVRLSLVNRALLDQAGLAAPPSRWDQVPASPVAYASEQAVTASSSPPFRTTRPSFWKPWCRWE